MLKDSGSHDGQGSQAREEASEWTADYTALEIDVTRSWITDRICQKKRS